MCSPQALFTLDIRAPTLLTWTKNGYVIKHLVGGGGGGGGCSVTWMARTGGAAHLCISGWEGRWCMACRPLATWTKMLMTSDVGRDCCSAANRSIRSTTEPSAAHFINVAALGTRYSSAYADVHFK